MANTILTPELIATQALASLSDELVMQKLVYTDVTKDFQKGKIGDTVNIRKPAVFEGKTFNRENGIEIQDINEESVPVKLDKIADVSFTVTNEELTLEIDQFDERILTPAMQAIAEKIDFDILALRDEIAATVGEAPDTRTWDKPESLIEAGRVLNANRVPSTDRAAVIGTGMNAEWLGSDLLKRVDQSGTDTALRRAELGKNLFGFNTYWTQNVEPAAAAPEAGDPTTEVGIAFHKTALSFTSVPFEIPPGAMGSVQSHEGLSIRVMYQNDIYKKQTVVSVDILYGVKVLDPKRAVLIKGADQA